MVEYHSSKSSRIREKNNNWRGGYSIASNGYVLVRVGIDHPLADVRGYAYEHRVVAEQKLGRRLSPGELVHHLDENKQNNHPDNLEVKASVAEHFLEHRKPGSNLRLPSEANTAMMCACGCGIALMKFDAMGRPRSYISGHNPHDAPTREAIEQAIRLGHSTCKAIKIFLALSPQAIRVALSKMVKTGRLVRRDHGVYGLPGSTLLRQQETILCTCGCGLSLLRYDSLRRERRFISGHNRRRRG